MIVRYTFLSTNEAKEATEAALLAQGLDNQIYWVPKLKTLWKLGEPIPPILYYWCGWQGEEEKANAIIECLKNTSGFTYQRTQALGLKNTLRKEKKENPDPKQDVLSQKRSFEVTEIKIALPLWDV